MLRRAPLRRLVRRRALRSARPAEIILDQAGQVRAAQDAGAVGEHLRQEALAQLRHAGPVHLGVPVVLLVVAVVEPQQVVQAVVGADGVCEGVARLAAVVLCTGLAGCQGLFSTHGPPDDPLFLDKKPLEAKAHYAAPVALAYADLSPPANPYFADDRPSLVNRPRPPRSLAPVPGTLTNRPRTVDPDDDPP